MNTLYQKTYFNRRNFILSEIAALDISAEETFILLYIDYCNEFNINFDLEQTAKQCKMTAMHLDQLLNSLMNRGYVEIKMQNRQVIYCLDGVFRVKENLEVLSTNEYTNLFELYESEFARPLTSLESQRLSEWMATYDLQLIEYALREAVVYEKRSFDYIDVILINWKEKQLTAKDYEEGKR
ncbi:DNA replication protein [Breznakia sp. PF5-3]|uniref:DnaD domain-containing protein n=1 Tax=unclassified Breznakia TaxID=2623764 RepID=UPI0024065C57|nr:MULTISPECIES: DnaD domain protein [unclassified Breznakia]MDF9824083.1 DNA replication protein [Breznakia sp. PM6-1]MDF9834851.1 DNA replication protein [Breznakia sp. PF5-3]MDF9837127.1 DNA replication protein [Breznakia sp. PFB2-8]MDF9859052.1 DNA replication protein [Breznakia sp. PH5-24]